MTRLGDERRTIYDCDGLLFENLFKPRQLQFVVDIGNRHRQSYLQPQSSAFEQLRASFHCSLIFIEDKENLIDLRISNRFLCLTIYAANASTFLKSVWVPSIVRLGILRRTVQNIHSLCYASHFFSV